MKRSGLVAVAAALVFAGCIGDAAPELDAAVAEAAAEPAVDVEPFTAEGSTFHGAAVCLPMQCLGTGLPGGGTSWFEVDLEGTLEAAELTLTWDAATPATSELLLGIAYEDEEGAMGWVYTTGSSPLVLSESGLGLPAEDVQAVYVNAFRCTGPACVSLEQAFAIEGTLTTVGATPS